MKNDTHLTEAFHDLVAKSMRDWHVPGLAIAVVRGNEIDTKGYGFAKYPDKKMKEDNLFDCASTSKSFTAAAVALLVDDNEHHPDVQWKTPVSTVIPDFVLQDSYATANVTIEDILSHRSGMPRHDDSTMGPSAKEPDTPKSITRNFRNLPMSRPPKAEYQYCNLMYTAASHLVEAVSGRSFENFLRDRIWDPLEMRDTYLGITADAVRHVENQLAQGYCWDKEKQENYAIPWCFPPDGQGAGSIFSSVQDFARWIRMMIAQAPPLSPSCHQALIQPRIISQAEDEQSPKPFHSHLLYALGWELQTYRGYTVIGHDGGVTGFGSLMRYLPQLDWGVVIFANSDCADGAPTILCWHLIDELLSVPPSERFDWDIFERQQQEKYIAELQPRTEDLYPDVPSRPLPLSAPLRSHIGQYHNAGYHSLVVDLLDDGTKLHVDARDRSYGFDLFFEHVSGEDFIAERIDMYDRYNKERLKARFLVGPDGVVEGLGIAFEEAMEEDPMVWFSRVEG